MLSARRQERDKISTDVLTACRFDQQRTHLTVVRGKEVCAFQAVSVKDPASHEQRRPLIPFSEGLRSGHPVSQYGGGLDGVLDQIDGCESTSDPVEFIGFVEPLVLLAYNVVDRNHEVDGRSIQWSCR